MSPQFCTIDRVRLGGDPGAGFPPLSQPVRMGYYEGSCHLYCPLLCRGIIIDLDICPVKPD